MMNTTRSGEIWRVTFGRGSIRSPIPKPGAKSWREHGVFSRERAGRNKPGKHSARRPVADPAAAGQLAGRLRYADGSAVSDAPVTLGLEMLVQRLDPATYMETGLGVDTALGDQRSLATRTDSEGRFLFEQVPPGRHEFLAVSLDADKFDIATRFIAQGIIVECGKRTDLDLVVEEWSSVPGYEVASPFDARLDQGGVSYRLVHEEKLHNPFHYPFPRQDVRFPLPPGVPANPRNSSCFHRLIRAGRNRFRSSARPIVFFADLPAVTDRVFALYAAETGQAEAFSNPADLQPVIEPGGTAVIDTGRAELSHSIWRRLRQPAAADRRARRRWKMARRRTFSVTAGE